MKYLVEYKTIDLATNYVTVTEVEAEADLAADAVLEVMRRIRILCDWKDHEVRSQADSLLEIDCRKPIKRHYEFEAREE